MQQNLFEGFNSVSTTSSIVTTIKVTNEDDKATKKLKNLFNSRMRSIQNLRDKVDKFDVISADLMKLYQEKVRPHEEKLNEYRLKVLESLDKAYHKKSFSKIEKELLIHEILEHVRILHEDPSDYDLGEYDKYMDIFTNELTNDDLTLDLMKEMMGMMGMEDADPRDFAGDQKLTDEELKEKYFSKENEAENESEFNPEEPSVKKAPSRNEDMLETNFSKKYKKLAKRIHPDLEQDQIVKEKKETLMKELASAKENQDLFQLISIQSRVDQIEFGEARIDESYLKETCDYLLDQKKELERDIYVLKNKSGMVSWLYKTFFHHTSAGKSKKIARYIEELDEDQIILEETMEELKTVKRTKAFIHLKNEEMHFDPFFW